MTMSKLTSTYNELLFLFAIVQAFYPLNQNPIYVCAPSPWQLQEKLVVKYLGSLSFIFLLSF